MTEEIKDSFEENVQLSMFFDVENCTRIQISFSDRPKTIEFIKLNIFERYVE